MPTFDRISELEATFELNKRASGGIYFNTVSAIYPNATGLRPKTSKTGSQYDSYYYEKEYPKKKIILHSTVGFLTGDLSMLAKQNIHMSTNYVIARNGTVYELFNPKYWSYHLGIGAVGGNGYGSKESISIELSNIGPLTLEGTTLKNVYGSKYCSITDTDAYTEYTDGFRGYKYFATFTNEQYASLQSLLTFLTDTYNIPYNFLPESKRVNVFSSSIEARAYKGICSHVNFRASGKYDIGPDFIWENITSDAEPIVPSKDTKFIFEDDIQVENVYDLDYGKVTQTAAEKAQISNNSNSSHFCSLSNIDSQDETYEGGVIGNKIIEKLDTIDWASINYKDINAMRKASTDMIAEAFYEYITSTDTSGEPIHFSLYGNITGTHIIPPSPTPIPVVGQLKFANITWPSLDSLKNILNKFYTGIPDLFSSIFEEWLGTIVVSPISDNPAVFFLSPAGIPTTSGPWLSGDFKFKWDSTLVEVHGKACELALALKLPNKLIETWTIIQEWIFKTLSSALVGEQAGTDVFVPGPSTGAISGGGASIGYCLGLPQNIFTIGNSTCVLTFSNPDV